MRNLLAVTLVTLSLAVAPAAVVAQDPPVLGDLLSVLNPLGGEGNTGISNAVLREQADVRVLRVVIDAGGVRAMHEHADVRFHLFMPISAPMELRLEDGTIEVQPWHPYYLVGGTQHGFHNPSGEPVDVIEVFIREP